MVTKTTRPNRTETHGFAESASSRVSAISRETHRLRDLILAEAHAQGVPLRERALRTELDLPVLRFSVGGQALYGCWVRLPGRRGSSEPDVITVHGSGLRASRTWPRQRDAGFKIADICRHLLALVDVELARLACALKIPSGVSAAASGLHVVHLAAMQLGVLPSGSSPVEILDRFDDPTGKGRIENHLRADGMTAADMRALGDAMGVYVGRPNKIDFDPLEPVSDRIMTTLVLGEGRGLRVERRYILILDRRGDQVVIADPARTGRATLSTADIRRAWMLGVQRGSRRPRMEMISVKADVELDTPSGS